jgi:hypothetical protein
MVKIAAEAVEEEEEVVVVVVGTVHACPKTSRTVEAVALT